LTQIHTDYHQIYSAGCAFLPAVFFDASIDRQADFDRGPERPQLVNKLPTEFNH
jgi:hypothetical protein